MYSSKDLERVWFLYKTEGEPKGVSINSFCVSNNVPYTVFYDWYKKPQKKAVPVEMVDVPTTAEKEEPVHTPLMDEAKPSPKSRGSFMVTIKTREGLCIQKKDLDYQCLKTLVEKLEGLC